jgi:hypothetical protein
MPELLSASARSLGLAYKAALLSDKVTKASRKEILRQVKRHRPLGHVPGYFIAAVNMARVYEQPVVKNKISENLIGLPGEKNFGTFLAGWRTQPSGSATEKWLPAMVGIVAVRDKQAAAVFGDDIMQDILYGTTAIDIDGVLAGLGIGGGSGSGDQGSTSGWDEVVTAGLAVVGAILGAIIGVAGAAFGAVFVALIAFAVALWDALTKDTEEDEEEEPDEEDEEEEPDEEDEEDEDHGIMDETGPGWLINTDFVGQEAAFVQLALAAGLVFSDAVAKSNTVVLTGPRENSVPLVLAF